MPKSEEYFYADEEGPVDRFEVLSTVIDEPGEVVMWCCTGAFEKALAVFELLQPHCHRLGYENLALLDGWRDTVVRRGA
ncbi:hypothetical protein [Brevundimonas sp. RM1]